ncbi:MAG: hypothetical protein KKB31_01205 [Nanoarchaeota archaeon]|nr:hypothetical protein [Nanoarchaeota archaeon]
MSSIIAPLLNQTIDYVKKISVDGYGDETYTVIYSDVPCRWQEEITQEILINGQVVTYTIKAFLLPNYDLKENFRVIKDSKNYTIRKIDHKYDISGTKDHLEAYLN